MNLYDHFQRGAYELNYLFHAGVVEVRSPKDNPLFTELEHRITLFIRPTGDAKWICPACGRKRGRQWFWTQLIPFKASLLEGSFAMRFGEVLPALTPVCSDHCLSPASVVREDFQVDCIKVSIPRFDLVEHVVAERIWQINTGWTLTPASRRAIAASKRDLRARRTAAAVAKRLVPSRSTTP